ncbi:hypothetical protein ACFQX8_27690 [Klenkia terrae]|uniref:hypothetical protein n=1 Tax=Klenkia terrae TaxID=1052259 RepID=UPI00361A5DDC
MSGLAADVAEVLVDAACLAGGRLEADPEHVPVELAETTEQRAGRSGRLGTAGERWACAACGCAPWTRPHRHRTPPTSCTVPGCWPTGDCRGSGWTTSCC